MIINPAIFILLIAAILGLALVILFIIQSYNHLISKIEQADNEKIQLHDSINQKATQILEDTHKQNVQIIEEANRQAAQILSTAKDSKSGAEEMFKGKFDELIALQKQNTDSMNERFSKNYEEALEKLKSQDIKNFESISSVAADTLSRQMQDFGKTLKEETVDAHAIMQERIEQEYARTEEEIEKYKQEQLKKINASVYPLLKNVISLVIGKSLNPADHEDLVTQAIQEARQQWPEQSDGGQAAHEFPKK